MFRPILDPGTSKIQVRGIIVSNSLFGCSLADPCVYGERVFSRGRISSLWSSRRKSPVFRQTGRYLPNLRKNLLLQHTNWSSLYLWYQSAKLHDVTSQKFVILKSYMVNCYHGYWHQQSSRKCMIQFRLKKKKVTVSRHCCGLRMRIRREPREWQYCEMCGIFGRPSIPSKGWCEDMCRSDTFRSKFYFLQRVVC